MAVANRICSVSDCNKRVIARGLCDTHYARARRAADKAAGIVRVSPRRCTMPECGKPHFAKGYCSAHYTRRRRHGDPVGGSTSRGEPLAWIDRHIDYAGDDCLPWPFATGRRGEAVVSHEGKQKSASAVMCLFAHGEPPTPKHECAHNCGNGHLGCMNPHHLRWATRAENMADKHIHGTMNAGERHPFHRLTEDQVRYILSCDLRTTDLAKIFGVSKATVSAIRLRKRWAWLDPNCG